MNILFSHTNYPAQFKRLAPSLADVGHEVVFLHKNVELNATEHESIKLVRYSQARYSASELGSLHPYLGRFEDAVLEGQAAARSAVRLKERGFYPDVIISHAGFGNGLYLQDVFPDAKRIGFFEWYYTNLVGGDVEYLHRLHNQLIPLDRSMRLRTWNAVTLLELAQCDALVTPTHFQAGQFPHPYRDMFNVIHEGVDIDTLGSLNSDRSLLPLDCPIDSNSKIVTHVARGFELYRGFPQAILALAELQRRCPDVHVLIAGSDQVCYGGPEKAPNGQSWGNWARSSSGLMPERTHWLGAVKTQDFHSLLANSDAHLYLTIPFVLSWSLLEAMAAGVPLVCSNTGPVLDVLNSSDALLVPFDNPKAIADGLQNCLYDPVAALSRASSAKTKASRYSATCGLSAWRELIGQWA